MTATSAPHTADGHPVRPVFVLGTGRCGSTLLHELLARHPATAFVTNLDDRGLWLSSTEQVRTWRRLPPGITTKGRVRFAPSEGYRALSREVSPLVVDPATDIDERDVSPWLVRRLRTFVHRRSTRMPYPVFLHKFTGWPRIHLLQAAFPDAIYVHVVRDGRAVVNSWLQMPWWKGHLGPSQWHFGPLSDVDGDRWASQGRTQVALAALAWEMLTVAHDKAEDQMGGRWLTLRHENLVADPTHTLQQVLDHVGLETTPSFETSLRRHPVTAARNDAFRSDLSPAQIRSINSLIEDQLLRYGYPAT